MESTPPDRSSELVQLMMTYQRRIFAYIHTLVPSRSDAEDILQEASLTICEKFKDFEVGTNFYSWACQIAYWKVRAARKKFATAKVVFNQEESYYVHCAGGYRSTIFLSILAANGIEGLINIEGGFSGLEKTEKLELTDYACPTTLI